jgi:hypothetical protein
LYNINKTVSSLQLSMDDPVSFVNRIERTRKHAKTYSNANIDTSTKIKAKELLQKEELNSKKSRLECLLSQQFIGKYGSKQPNSQLNNMIKSAIKDYLRNCRSIDGDPRQFQALEHEVAEKSAEYKQTINTQRSEMVLARADSREDRDARIDLSGDASKSQSMNPHQWAVLNAIQSLSVEEQARKEKSMMQVKKMKFKYELDEQLARVEEKKRQEADDKLRLKLEVERVNEALEREKELVKAVKLKKHELDRDLIVCQIEERKKKKEAEKELSILQDKVEMRRAQARAREEEEIKAMKKTREKESQEALRVENERVKAAKKEEKLRQYALEKKMEEEYRQKLDREEQTRAESFNKRLESMNRFAQKYDTDGAGARERSVIERNEERLQMEIHQKIVAEEEAARRKEELAKERRRLVSEDNLKIIQEKERRKNERREESVALKERFASEYSESQEAEGRKAERKRIQAQEIKRGLDVQIEEKKRSQSLEVRNGLTPREIELNKSLLKKMQDDPLFQDAIYKKLNPPQTKSSGFAFA